MRERKEALLAETVIVSFADIAFLEEICNEFRCLHPKNHSALR